MRLSERLEAILQEFRDNWAELREALEHLRIHGGTLRDTNLEDLFFRLSGGAI